MNMRTLVACLAALVLSSTANAITFFGVHGQVDAVAVAADALPDFQSLSGSPAGDPLTAEAVSGGAVHFATAGSIVGLGLLSSSADVSGGEGSNAVAVSRFSGAFVNEGPVNLGLEFMQMDSASGSGLASTTLFVSLVSDGVSLFRDYVPASWYITYDPVVGTTSLLDVLLTSEASVAFGTTETGNAAAFGQVSLVPEAPTWLLFPLGVGAVLAVKRRTRRVAARTSA